VTGINAKKLNPSNAEMKIPLLHLPRWLLTNDFLILFFSTFLCDLGDFAVNISKTKNPDSFEVGIP